MTATHAAGAYPADDPKRLRPYEAVTFEYRIDRRPRLLRRDHMFPNRLHPRGLPMDEEFFVCNSIHSHNLRGGHVFIAAGAHHDFPAYPNEHHLLLLSGSAAIEIEGTTVELATRGDQIFIPAFERYTVRNAGSGPLWFFSGYLRILDWSGMPQADTPVAEEQRHHRVLPSAPPYQGEGWAETPGLVATHVRARTVDIAAGARIEPRHLHDEQVVVGLEGTCEWHIDGFDYRVGPEDLLFVPAMAPFSVRSPEGCRVFVYDVSLRS